MNEERALTSAESDLIESHLYLVAAAVGQIHRGGPIPKNDFWSAGVDGLIDAARKYNPGKGLIFAPYAKVRVRGAIVDMMREQSGYSRRGFSYHKKIENQREAIEAETGLAASNAVIAGALGVSQARFAQMKILASPIWVQSLDRPIDFDDERSDPLEAVLCDTNADSPRDAMERTERLEIVERLLKRMPRRTKEMISLYFVDRRPMREISAVYGIGIARVSQIISRGINDLKTTVRMIYEKENREPIRLSA